MIENIRKNKNYLSIRAIEKELGMPNSTMKKVPHWIQKVIFVSQAIYCADARNRLLNDIISGEFDMDEFYVFCKNTYNIKVDGKPDTANNYYEAIERCDKNFEPINMQRLLNEAGL